MDVGSVISVQEFTEILGRDSTFVDYLNTFLNLPVKTKVNKYSSNCYGIIMCRFSLGG